MKNRLVRALLIGLSAIMLAGPVNMTVYAKTIQARNDVDTTIELNIAVNTDSDEAEEDGEGQKIEETPVENAGVSVGAQKNSNDKSELETGVAIEEENPPLAITSAGVLQHVIWFACLAIVLVAGAGISIFEVKKRAAAKIIDKLNQ